MKIAVIDNYDSFTYNLVHAIQAITGSRVKVYRNDQLELDELDQYDKLVLSPGPGIPDEAGMLKEIIRKYGPEKSILGVCLGHQAIAEVYGGHLLNINQVFHGVATAISIQGGSDFLFSGISTPFKGGRYHSWIVSREGLPGCFNILAEAEDGEIMALAHKEYDIRGVQFHPESVLTECGNQIIENWLKH